MKKVIFTMLALAKNVRDLVPVIYAHAYGAPPAPGHRQTRAYW